VELNHFWSFHSSSNTSNSAPASVGVRVVPTRATATPKDCSSSRLPNWLRLSWDHNLKYVHYIYIIYGIYMIYIYMIYIDIYIYIYVIDGHWMIATKSWNCICWMIRCRYLWWMIQIGMKQYTSVPMYIINMIIHIIKCLKPPNKANTCVYLKKSNTGTNFNY
jgi:hypothetical protein